MATGCGDVLSLEDLKIAKLHQLFEAEVITGRQGGVSTGAEIEYATNQVTGQTQKTLPAVLRDSGYRPAAFDFNTGGTLSASDQYRAVLWPSPAGDGLYYFWAGAFPKIIPAGSTPASTGGVGAGAWLPTTGVSRPSSVSFTQFGAKGDGITNDAPAVAAAFDYALANNVAVIQSSGTFLLDGATYINIKNIETDLTGCVIKPSSAWTGQIVISQPEGFVDYPTGSSVVTAANTSSVTSRAAGSNLLDGLTNSTELNGCFVQISTSQPLFVFRGATQTRKDYNRVYSKGNLENPLRYVLGNNITNIRALKIRKNVQTVRGLTIDESVTRRYRIVFVNYATRVKLENTSFINRPLTQSFSDTRIELSECYDVEVNGLFAPTVTDSFDGSGDIYSYTFGMGDCMNVRVKNATANGEGWGATGSNNSANITFEECDLSRIDFHMPFQNYLKVIRCNVGRHGVLTTGTGDLTITGCTFNASPDTTGNVVATRADAGGWFDGDLYMSDITLTGRRAAGAQGIALINGTSSAGQGPTPIAGSPIKSTLFNKIVLRDIKLREGSIENMFGTLISSNNDSVLLFPSVIDIDGFDFAGLPKSAGIGLNIDFARFKAVYSDMNNGESPVTGRITTDILLRDIKSPFISVTGGNTGSLRHNPHVVINNARHIVVGDGNTTFTTNQRGNYELSGCALDNIKLYFGSSPNGPVYLKMNGGSITQPTAATLPLTVTEDTHFIELNNVSISAQFNGQDATYPITRNLARYALLNSCDFWDYSSSTKQAVLPFFSPTGSLSVTSTVPLRVGQQYVIASGYTGNSTYTKTSMQVSDSSSDRTVAAIAAGTIVATYTISGYTASQIVITAPTGNEISRLYVK